MTQPDEPLDPLDPRFVDAVLARARRRVIDESEAARTTAAVAAQPTAIPPGAVEASPVEVISAAPAEAPVVPSADPFAVHEDEPPREAAVLVDPPVPVPVDPELTADGDDEDDEAARRARNIVEWIAVAAGAVIVAFLIRAFLLQAFYIPSESMEPTLSKDDRILVNKLSYDLHDVNRGDLVVFEKPPNEPAGNINDLIKRAIALEGETIELHQDGTITIDGRLLTEPYVRDPAAPGPLVMSRESFLEGACTNPVTETTKCTVADNYIFVMGDNRDHSHDGRAFGPIPEDLIVGRAFVKVWPLSGIGFL